MIETLVNFVQWNPLVSMLVFAFIITTILSLLYKILINKEKFDSVKEKQKNLREKSKECKDEPEKMVEIQREMLQTTMDSLKLTMKPMLITFIPLMIIFLGLKKLYMDLAGIGNIFSWNANLPFVGNGGGWLFCYILFSFIFSIILRKIFKV